MPDRSYPRTALLPLVIALGLIGLLLMLSLTTSVTAQSGGTPTPVPTTALDAELNLPATVAFATATLDPSSLPSLTGVGGEAVNADVIIHSGPGLVYRSIGYLPKGQWIDIVGWNGWEVGRECSPVFRNDLDMWVQVQYGAARGWIARCTLDIRGKLTQLPIVTASGERILQR
jgi:uncharacterized protein YraI